MTIDIKSLLIGAGIFALFAFTTKEMLTVKPAQPRNVLAVACTPNTAEAYVRAYTKQGYIFKSFSAGAHLDYYGLLIMEKY